MLASARTERSRTDEIVLVLSQGAILTGVEADLIEVWLTHGFQPPTEILVKVRAGLEEPDAGTDSWTRAGRWVARRLMSAATDPASYEPPSGDWRALVEWASLHGIACEGDPLLRERVAARVNDLLSGAQLAIASREPLRAARIARVAAAVCLAPATRRRLLEILPVIEALAGEDPWPVLHVAAARASLAVPALPADSRRARGQVRDGAIRWMHEHLHLFSMNRARFRDSLKAIGELSMAAELMARQGASSSISSMGNAWLDRLWQELGDGELLAEIISGSPGSQVFFTITLPFSRTGRTSASLRAVAGRMPKDWDTSLGSLLIATSLAAMGVDPKCNVGALSRARPLAQQPPPYLVPRLGVYDIMHTVFALTAMGQWPGGLPALDAEYLCTAAPVWLEMHARQGHLDLMAEVIAGMHCANVGCVPPATWQTLAVHQHAEGDVPFSLGGAKGAGDYHSTIAALMSTLTCDH